MLNILTQIAGRLRNTTASQILQSRSYVALSSKDAVSRHLAFVLNQSRWGANEFTASMKDIQHAISSDTAKLELWWQITEHMTEAERLAPLSLDEAAKKRIALALNIEPYEVTKFQQSFRLSTETRNWLLKRKEAGLDLPTSLEDIPILSQANDIKKAQRRIAIDLL